MKTVNTINKKATCSLLNLIKWLTFSALLFSSQKAFSVGIVGADMTYQCTGTPGVYQVTLKLFRDCSGPQLCANCPTALSPSCSMPIVITGVGGACNGIYYGSQSISVITSVSGFDVVSLGAPSTSICSNCGTRTPGTFTPGYEVYTFQGNINLNSLPAGCCMVSPGYTDCCRNANNASLVNPSTLPFYIEVILNRCMSPCNSGPMNLHDPIVIFPSGRDMVLNLGAADPDGDSLSYAIAPELTARGVSAPYVYPYSAPNFPFLLHSSIGMNINQQTGNIYFKPLGSFLSSLSIEVTQWGKNGLGVPVIAGITRRSMPVHCINSSCTANLGFASYDTLGSPKTSPGPTGKVIKLCPGQTFSEIVVSQCNSPTDTTYFLYNTYFFLNLPGGTFRRLYNDNTRGLTGPRQDSGMFVWTMPLTPFYNQPYLAIFDAYTKYCQVPNRGMITYSFYASTEAPAIQIIKTQIANRTYRLGYTVSNNVYVNSTTTQWQIETAPGSNLYTVLPVDSISSRVFNAVGKFKVKLLPGNPCGPTEYVDTIEIKPLKLNLLSVQGNTCYGDSTGSLVMNALNYFGSVQYKLNNGTYQSSGSFTHLAAGNYWVFAKDSLLQKDSILVQIMAPPALSLNAMVSSSLKCNGDGNGKILLTAQNGVSPFEYKKSGGMYSTINEYTNLLAGTYTFWVKDSNQCQASVQTSLNQPAPLVLTLITKKDESCPGKKDGSGQIQVSGGTTPYHINWQTNPIQTGNNALGLSGGITYLNISDTNQCAMMGSVSLSTRLVFNNEQICGVSIDTISGLAGLSWNKTQGVGIAKYYVFRSISAAGPFILIDSVSFQSTSQLIDPIALTPGTNKFYQLRAVDSCNRVSAGQTLHKPLLGSASLVSGRVHLSWNSYQGKTAANIEVLRITNGYRYLTIGLAGQTDSLYIDSFPSLGSNKYLLLLNGFNCHPYDSTMATIPIYSNVMSASISSGLAKFSQSENFEIYPNPSGGLFTLKKKLVGTELDEITLFSLEGRELKKWKPDNSLQEESIDIRAFDEGMYLLLLRMSNQAICTFPLVLKHGGL